MPLQLAQKMFGLRSWSGKGVILSVALLGLGACYDDAGSSMVSGGGDLVRLAAEGTAAELQAALDGADLGRIAGLRYGPADNGLAHAAVANRGNPDAVAQVARAGADVNLIDANGRTPLHFAIEMQAEAALLRLLDVGANPDIQTGMGQSPRDFCIDALKSLQDYQVCRIMIERLG